MASSVRESIQIDADATLVYDLIADVSSVGSFSPEATGALGAGARLEVGDTFWGTNRRGPWIWATQCRVTRADRGAGFAFDVAFGPFPLSSWTYEIESIEGRCAVTETWVDRREGRRGQVISRAGSLLIPGPRDEHNRRNIRASLEGLKAAAEDRSTA